MTLAQAGKDYRILVGKDWSAGSGGTYAIVNPAGAGVGGETGVICPVSGALPTSDSGGTADPALCSPPSSGEGGTAGTGSVPANSSGKRC